LAAPALKAGYLGLTAVKDVWATPFPVGVRDVPEFWHRDSIGDSDARESLAVLFEVITGRARVLVVLVANGKFWTRDGPWFSPGRVLNECKIEKTWAQYASKAL
jgi:hypothetical protein